MFGLFQGGIVPSYAIIVRESMPAREAATRVGIVILASVVGMSFGGWVSGVIFDATGSYAAAFTQRRRLERGQHRHHDGAVDPGAQPAGDGVRRDLRRRMPVRSLSRLRGRAGVGVGRHRKQRLLGRQFPPPAALYRAP